jgi:AcrR family transcriptional regulator
MEAQLVPRFVDHDKRREDILRAASGVLAEAGYAGFSLRAVGQRMGGSTTLVTHYFATRDQLISELTAMVFAEVETDREEIDAIADPGERLRAALEYFLVLDEESVEQERIRFALLPYRRSDPHVEEFFTGLETSMRSILRAGIEGSVDPADVENHVSTLRVWVNGIALSAIENPKLWDSTAQRAALERFVGLLDGHR